MKKIYETPICQTVYTAEEDILTASQFTIAKKVDDEGGFEEGGIIRW
jgi:hypothetical protein